MLSFLLFSRERLNIKAIRSFDKDPFSTEKADIVNENWVFRQWLFKAKTIDCNKLSYKNLFFADSEMPDLIINTSTEHFESLEWWDNIPFGKTVALQSCDLKLKDHVRPIHSERQFEEIFPAKKILYSGTKKFIYPDNSFNRYTLIVEK